MLEIGSLVDNKYKILNKIGQGGMSTVYLAMNERANKQWAIKEVRKTGVANYEVVKQSLIVETDLLKQLSHPYLPSIVDVIDEEEEGCFLIVMDYIEGNTLNKAVQEYGALPQEYVIEWAKQLCDVLGYLHSRKPAIIYRDLKPGNIMLRPDGTITLIDFGTARQYKRESIEDTTCLGTRGYAAPEQFGGRGQTDARTDIYCLGATLYHLLTGHNPCDPPYEIYPIRHWNASLSQGLERIILKCTQQNPADRYQSCAEVLYDLEHYQELDNNYRHLAKMKMAGFCTAAALAIVCGVASFGFYTSAESVEANSYDAYVADAQGEVTVDKQIGTYGKAISIDPANEDAYLKLLNNVYMADDDLSPEEDAQLRKLLITSYNGTDTYEQVLATNEKDYADFAYRLGLAYYYSYDNNGNKQMSSKWLNIAAQSETLADNQKQRAVRLGKIASYYASIGRESKSGDATVSYKDYWQDLTAITQGNIAEADNATTAMMVYKEMIYQIYCNANHFKKDGITRKEMQAQIDNITTRLDTDITVTDEANAERITNMKKTLKDNIVTAQKSLDGAFQTVN